MRDLTGAEAGLSCALGRLFALAEANSDLKANENMLQLSGELTSEENKISFARQAYNDAVMAYNTQREVFPANIIASMFNFAAAELFLIQNASGKRDAKSILHMIPLESVALRLYGAGGTANVVPVWTEIVADGDTPVSAFAKIGGEAPSFLLESAEQSDQVGRYSFLGAGARLMISARDKTVTVTENGKIRTFESARDPLDELQKIMARYRCCARAKPSGFSRRRGRLSRL